MCVIVALAVGWYVDTQPSLRSRLVGKWRHPFPGVGYWENLYLDTDGRFRRVVHYRVGKDIYEGKYEILTENKLSFSFEQCWDSGCQAMRRLTSDEKENADCWVSCAFDRDDNLLLVNLNPDAAGNDSFECGIPSRNYERGEFKFKRVVPNNTKGPLEGIESSSDVPCPFDGPSPFADDPFDDSDPFET